MIAIQVQDVKVFMSNLLIHNMFDEFLMSEMDLSMAQTFHIDGSLNMGWFSTDELESLEGRKLAKWLEVKPIAYHIIKGQKTPNSFKIVFQLNQTQLTKLVSNSGASLTDGDVNGLFMNVKYEKGVLTIITGSSLKVFTMDKSLDNFWDDTVKQFLRKYQIAFTEE